MLERFRAGDLHAALIGWGLVSPNTDEWSATILDRPRGVPLVLLAISGSDEHAEGFGREHPCAMLTPPFQLRALWSAMRAIDAQKEYA